MAHVNSALHGSNKERSVRLSLEELITAITGDEFDDGTNIVRATLEDDTLQNVTSVTEDENPQQLVYEGLSHLYAGEVDHDLTVSLQHFFSLPAHWCSISAGSQHTTVRIGFQRESCAMFKGFHTYIIAQNC